MKQILEYANNKLECKYNGKPSFKRAGIGNYIWEPFSVKVSLNELPKDKPTSIILLTLLDDGSINEKITLSEITSIAFNAGIIKFKFGYVLCEY